MPRPKFRGQKGQQKGRQKGPKNYKHSSGSNNKRKSQIDEQNPTGRKYKYIRRNQEAEETLRRQKDLESEFQKRNKLTQVDDEDVESSTEDEIDPMEQLMSTLSNGKSKSYHQSRKAIESSESEVSEADEAAGGLDDDAGEEEDELGEKIEDEDCDTSSSFPEQFEEQSKPRGRKYRSSEDEDDGDEEENGSENSDDDFSENTVLRPEESIGRREVDDSIEHEDDGQEAESSEDECEASDDEGKNIESDIYSLHLDHDLSPELLECVSTTHHSKKINFEWPTLGRAQVEIPTSSNDDNCEPTKAKKKKLTLLDDDANYAKEGTVPTLYDVGNIDLNELNIKVQIQPNVFATNKSHLKQNQNDFTPLQTELFSIINNYQDLFYSSRSHENGEEIRFIYTLHALNHVMKTRSRVLNHNLKLKQMADTKVSTAIVPDNYRDQGLFRTKVLIIAPFRESALRIVNNLIALTFGNGSGNKQVMHYKRFLDEFGGQTLHFPKRNPKPEDYELTFAGNSDDTFRLGITITRKSIKLYSDFYSSDILIVSPLGLRMIVGAPGDKERDYDFLASIELLILDQAEIFLAQNWDHLLHVLDHLHLQPQSARNTDFSRVRSWCLNGWTRFYRQTLLFSSHELPEFRSLFTTRCSNYRGKVRLANSIEDGSIKHVAVQIPQVFQRIDVTSIHSSFDQRFEHFVNHVLPKFKSAAKAHCLVFVPSYFDFVRIRNYFKKETINFVQICEYTKVSLARDNILFDDN